MKRFEDIYLSFYFFLKKIYFICSNFIFLKKNLSREKRLQILRGGGELISESELKQINADYQKNKKYWRERKRRVTLVFSFF